MTTFCTVLPNIVYIYQKQYCVAVLTNLDEAEPIVVKSLWDAVLITLTKIEVNKSKSLNEAAIMID